MLNAKRKATSPQIVTMRRRFTTVFFNSRTAKYVAVTFSGFFLFCLMWHFLLSWSAPSAAFLSTPRLGSVYLAKSKTKAVLIAIAHPDDECMFFGPTIRRLVRSPHNEVYIVCFSMGNFYGKGEERVAEFYDSCQSMGIKKENIFIERNSNLKDDKYHYWNISLVSSLILNYTKTNSIQDVITFDSYGVSDHPNHKSIYLGARHALSRKHLSTDLTAYGLESTNTWRTYSSVLDVPYSYVSSSAMITASWGDWFVLQKAFFYSNKSQFQWSRMFYMLTSRYILYNTLDPLEPLDNVPKNLQVIR